MIGLRRALAMTLALACASAPHIASAQSAAEFAVPPYQGAYQPQGVDEQGLWAMDDESERVLRESRQVVTDADLNAYVRSVLCRAVGQDRCASVRIYILRVPAFNASMSPNGTMRVFTGLLLRARNEAELASVLGHEFGHFEMRHTLAGFRRARTGTDMLAWTTLLAGVTQQYGTYSGPSVRDMRVETFGAIQHFKRDQERAADFRGFAYLAQAKYRPSAAAEVWRSVMNEADGSAHARGQRTARYDSVAFFASHPTDLERADTLSLLANRVAGGSYDGTAEYDAAIGPWRRRFLADEMMTNDFGGTDYLLNHLAGDHWTADLLYARGELYRNRGNPRDLINASEFYRNVLKADAGYTDAYHGLGLALLRSGSQKEGADALNQYLQRNPKAPDAATLRALID